MLFALVNTLLATDSFQVTEFLRSILKITDLENQNLISDDEDHFGHWHQLRSKLIQSLSEIDLSSYLNSIPMIDVYTKMPIHAIFLFRFCRGLMNM